MKDVKDNLKITSQFFVWKFSFRWLKRVKDLGDEKKYDDSKMAYKIMLVRFFQDKVLNQAKKTWRV